MNTVIEFLKKHSVFLWVGALVAYVVVAGSIGSCPPCMLITDAIGIPSLAQKGKGSAGGGGAMAPAWTLQDLDGKQVSSAELAGKVVLVDFWATWCPPCRKMIPGLVELQEKFRDRGLVVVGISLDEGGAETVREFNRKFGVNYLSLLGDAEVVSAFGGVRGIPTSFLIDREGRIVSRHVGYIPRDDLQAEIEPLL